MLAELLLVLTLQSRLGAAALASAGPASLGDGGRDALSPALAAHRVRSLELPFHLSISTQVWAEADGLQYIDQGPDAAPEAFFDDHFIGSLHAEHGSHWRGPLSPILAPGPHRLVLRSAQVQDAEDFVLRRIFVYANAPQKAARALVPADPGLLAPPRPAPENGCTVKERRDWPEAKKNGLILSVISGQVVPSGELVRLKDGEAWACALKISGHSSKPLALIAGFEVTAPAQGRWIFRLDADPPPVVEEKGYKPAHWERFRVEFCGGALNLRFGSNPVIHVPWPHPEISFEIAAQTVEVALRPLP